MTDEPLEPEPVITPAEPEKKSDDLDVSAVFAKLKQLGGKHDKDEDDE